MGTGTRPFAIVSSRMTRRKPSWRLFALVGCVAGLAPLVIGATVAHARDDSRRQTVAVVDGHAITEQDLDTTIKVELYQLRRRQLDQLIDNYLLEQAARRANLSLPQYLEKETAVTVTEADARAQYDKYKGLIKMSFDEVKPRLIASLTSQRQAQRQAALRAKLRSDAHIEFKLEPPRFEVATAHSPSIGPSSAPVTIVEFGDFQSNFCKTDEPVLQQVRERYGDQVRLVFKDFPPLTSTEAFEAAEAARCANEQGKFWQFHDALYADQTKLTVADLKATARGLGLDSAKFDSCLDSGKYSSAVEDDLEEGLHLGIRSVPTFFVNGYPHPGIESTAGFEAMIDPELPGAAHKQTKSP